MSNSLRALFLRVIVANMVFEYHTLKRLFMQVTPILQILYHAPNNTSHHIYMSLIILLILSEDETFNKRIHEIVSVLRCVSLYAQFYTYYQHNFLL